ncbi:hypothetical protein M8542_48365 [Amycolatopsis sp. OK19-0408]|uniref:Restriction endonuclease type IV Mrr domain-containing protein n=1 Tax=Amycolatopsis iheyensis TaxID=2945988 RepID=A0A9X2NMU7_9PSEU|nr:restriction endonuclease [Amycolatopsis iheyensis]MCR6490641.1 hypothetical protein [Amycolatopsis iheyensis]
MDVALQWIKDSSNTNLLAGHIHSHCKFFGELIHEIPNHSTHEALLHVARSQYSFSWEDLDPIRRRVAWLRSLELVELWGHKLVVTDSGNDLLNLLELADQKEVNTPAQSAPTVSDIPITGPSSVVKERTTTTTLTQRREPIGYIPRGANRSGKGPLHGSFTALEGLRKTVSLLGDGATVEEFKSSTQRELGVNAGSFNSMMHSLRHLEFIELVAYNKYGPTELAYACLQPGKEADLVRFLHSKFSFIGELLNAARELASTSELLTIARSSYGFNGDANEIRTRIALLTDSGYLERFDKSRARITPRGVELLPELTLQNPSATPIRAKSTDDDDDGGHIAPRVDVEEVVHRLRKFGSDGSRSTEFEIAVADAFELLGFSTRHIGGSNDTDVYIEANLPADVRYSAVVDSKATSSSTVPESQINYEAIKRHRVKNSADYAAIIAVNFARSVSESAMANGITVITVEDLASLVTSHTSAPIPLPRLRDAFDSSKRNLEGLDDAHQEARNDLALAAALISILQTEAAEDDPEDRGSATIGNLRFALRSSNLPFRPSKDQIRACLNLLAHPSLAAVIKAPDDEHYALADSPYNIALRLRAIADLIDSTVAPDQD